MKRIRSIFELGFLCLFFCASISAGEIHVAVAANFLGTMNEVAAQFEQTTGSHVIVSSGSTGSLYAQIENGAPYDIFLSADSEATRRLESAGTAVAGSRFAYAIGKLALWSADPKRVDQGGKVLRSSEIKHLAIPNPDIAPYGAAAQQVLQRMGLWESLKPRLVQGESVAQTFQFVAGGNAEAGFVAYSQVKESHNVGSCWIVPQEMYSPLEQQAVLLQRARDNPADNLSNTCRQLRTGNRELVTLSMIILIASSLEPKEQVPIRRERCI